MNRLLVVRIFILTLNISLFSQIKEWDSFTKKSDALINSEDTAYFYVQQEQLIDFNADPSTAMSRVDTVYDCNLRQHQIDKELVTDTLDGQQTNYEHLELQFLRSWEMKLKD